MKRYTVHFRSKKNATFTALSYSETDGKFFFHKNEDKSDLESFAFVKDVEGIDCNEIREITPSFTQGF